MREWVGGEAAEAAWLRSKVTLATSSIEIGLVFGDDFESGDLSPLKCGERGRGAQRSSGVSAAFCAIRASIFALDLDALVEAHTSLGQSARTRCELGVGGCQG